MLESELNQLLDWKYKDKEGNPIRQVWFTRNDVIKIIRDTEQSVKEKQSNAESNESYESSKSNTTNSHYRD